jgi:hypothetical protein
MTTTSEPRGLQFIQRIAALVCDEHQFTPTWCCAEDTYTLNVSCGEKQLTFNFSREILDRPGSDEYREAAEAMLARLLDEVRSMHARPASS